MKIAYSCVVDAKARFEWQAFLLIQSLIKNGNVDPEDIKIHCLPGVTDMFQAAISDLKVKIVNILPFDGHPYCNKIQQCFSKAFEGYDKIVLIDCDLYFLSLPEIHINWGFAAKIVDLPNPPLDSLTEIFRKAQVKQPEKVLAGCALLDEESTYATNFNGGVYIIDYKYLHDIGVSWRKYAYWLLDHINLLDNYHPHVDQVALSLALSELEIPVHPLTAKDNFPVHLPAERIENLENENINVFHYHKHILPDGKIKDTGIPKVDYKIFQANKGIEMIIAENFDNRLFWNMCYELFPEVGSGVGSRGDVLKYKQELLENVVRPFRDKKVLDVGCGDLETTKNLDIKNYTGYDVSDNALDIAREKRPDWFFLHLTSQNLLNEKANLVICLDVLLHQKTVDEYQKLIDQLTNIVEERLIISGYNAVPSQEYASEICAYHEPLCETLQKTGKFVEILEVGMYRGLSVFVADTVKTGDVFHQTDMSLEILSAVLPFVKRKDLLRRLMDVSREHLGFFTKTSIRAIEYPWILERIQNLNPGSNILDIGAGVSPLPIALTEYDYTVSCVDNHSMVRTLDTQSNWNEWGYLDYSMFSQNLISFQKDILQFSPSQKFDAVYSVSVIEHMPRLVWEKTLRLASRWLKSDGLLLLTLDLQPNTNALWNLSEGEIVDDDCEHGTLDDFVNELENQGFVFEEIQIKRDIPYSRTDVAFISCKLVKQYGIKDRAYKFVKKIFSYVRSYVSKKR